MPHRLYGHVDAAENYSVGRWCVDARDAASRTASGQGRLPILVGGTGLYFKALTQGLAAVPPIPPDIRAAGAGPADDRRRRAAACRAVRAAIRPPAARLMPGDRSRITRALEVCWRRPAARSPTGTARACRRSLDAARAQ